MRTIPDFKWSKTDWLALQMVWILIGNPEAEPFENGQMATFLSKTI